MADNILVVEYEPRYTDRVKHALSGQPIEPAFAKDGDEALRALDGSPKLIVISSVIPKTSPAELIKVIRDRKALERIPILLTMSGYTGKSTKQDALKLGATDILPKPYSESEFLGKVQEMLGVQRDKAAPGRITSEEIFGELLTEERAAPQKKTVRATDDLDKMLADTLSGVLPQKKRTTAPGTATVPPTAKPEEKAKPHSELDRMVEDTLSGLEKRVRGSSKAAAPRSGEQQAPPAEAQASDRIHAAEPLLTRPERVEETEESEPVDGVRFGPYVLLEKIATGGMAEVWKARRSGVEGFQKIVAIKKILPHLSDNEDFIEMFVDEAKLAAQLNHNNIIHIYDLGKIQGSYYIAMEYIDGWDLKTILKLSQERDQPLSIELSLFIASKIASALDYAHRKRDLNEQEMSLVHRDVSPQNVLISEEGDIKLCDFGIAKAASKASHTQAGALKGKLQYMSPEQAWGKAIDKRSDVFALCAVLFEMLTGRKLFAGDNEMSTLEQVREAQSVAPSQFNDEVTPEVDEIVLKGLRKDPADRYQTAGDLARDLDQILYSFRPTPTSADLAIYMHRLASSSPAVVQEPEPDPVPVPQAPVEPAPVAIAVPPAAVAMDEAPTVQMPVWDAPARAPLTAVGEPSGSKKSPVVPVAIAAGLVLAVAVGALVMRGKATSPTPAAANTQTIVEAPAAAPASATVAQAPTETLAPAPVTATAPTLTAVDEQRVQEEVQRRLAAERARLEEQARASTAPATATRAPDVAPQPVQVAVAEPQPAPVTETPQPQPQPQPPAPQPAAETRPAPPPPSPAQEAPRTQQGDLVAANAPGVAVARMTRRAIIPYPPMARAQRAEGTVLLNVLISETGQVIDVRVLRPFPRPVGLTEAAVATVRRSSFSPGTKDGVRVKMWIPVELNFKL
ncbi:MAG TPA: TonB family protein [Thermoanaerobaculia bacterium]|nr:TonB family protein [Thermoanaerobaculia bacterium]